MRQVNRPLLAILPHHKNDIVVYERAGSFRIQDFEAHEGGGAVISVHFSIASLLALMNRDATSGTIAFPAVLIRPTLSGIP